MTHDPIATAADYADALYTTRRAKNILELVLAVLLLTQLAVFFVARYGDLLPATADVEATTRPAAEPEAAASLGLNLLQYLTALSTFGGIALVIILALTLLLIVKIMLVGRLVGVGQTTSAYLWCLVLGVLLFPWQAFLSYLDLSGATFRLPGVLYTWEELVRDAQFRTDDVGNAVLKWARFVGFPVLALVLIGVIHLKSRRGMRKALGETQVLAPENP